MNCFPQFIDIRAERSVQSSRSHFDSAIFIIHHQSIILCIDLLHLNNIEPLGLGCRKIEICDRCYEMFLCASLVFTLTSYF